MLIFELLIGYSPFHSQDENSTFQSITNVDYTFPSKFYDFSAKDLIEKLLVADPNHRLGLLKSGIKELKNHIWFYGMDWSKLMDKEIEPPWIPSLHGSMDHSNYLCHDTEEYKSPETIDLSKYTFDF